MNKRKPSKLKIAPGTVLDSIYLAANEIVDRHDPRDVRDKIYAKLAKRIMKLAKLRYD